MHISKRGRFNENEAKFYIAELLLAIEYLHNANILYRDLKPENIFISCEGHIKLGDFGLSKENTTETEKSSLCGSPAYLAPEVINKLKITKATDLWGVGVILYEMVTG